MSGMALEVPLRLARAMVTIRLGACQHPTAVRRSGLANLDSIRGWTVHPATTIDAD
jgi:hypothetical protein